MTISLAFDMYGTLIDTHGVIVELERHLGDRAAYFSQSWREKQLEYSFRRGLMKKYKDFSICTRDAFEFTCSYYKIALEEKDKKSILNAYKMLPAFDDVKPGLVRARDDGFATYAFSNGSAEAVEHLLTHAGIREYFDDVVSVDEIKSFKPDPAVYRHFLIRAGAAAETTWLISGNPFDIIGATSCGMNTAWLRRSPDAVYDPWGIEPTVTINSLENLVDTINPK